MKIARPYTEQHVSKECYAQPAATHPPRAPHTPCISSYSVRSNIGRRMQLGSRDPY